VGGELQVGVDTVIVAIGQRAWLPFLEQSGLPLEADGTIAVDPSTGRTRVPGIYAGGDLVRGPATIVEACADGQRAAEVICQEMGVRFGGSEFEMASLSAGEIVQLRRRRAQKVKQERPVRLPVAQRDGFALVEQTLSAEAARVEAGRCLQCRTVCDKCVEVCPNRANYSYQVRPVAWTLPRLTHREGEVTVAGHEPFVVRQERQIVHLHDLCNECGNCATFCVHQGKPYQDKPRLILTKERFQYMQGDVWHWDSGCLWRRTSGTLHRLSLAGDEVLYTDGRVEARLSREFRLLSATAVEAFAGTISLRTAAEMAVVMEGLQASLPWLMRARSVLS
jgi:putative selenate reductase